MEIMRHVRVRVLTEIGRLRRQRVLNSYSLRMGKILNP
jgi:hypothetical protein